MREGFFIIGVLIFLVFVLWGLLPLFSLILILLVEDQNIEYKQSWRDEYLKWICGFANAQGGKIFIGIDDKGDVTGIEEYKKLMDEIPNKAVNHLGVVVDVNLHKKKNKHYIEIDIPINTTPISYHGVYH